MVRESARLISFASFSSWQSATFGLAPLLPAAAIAILTVAVNMVVDWVLHLSSGMKD
jgi:peptide/nickel transport system permease protein